MRFHYYINGWREGKSYFMSLGRFSDEEIQLMIDGEVITKGDNYFYIEVIEY